MDLKKERILIILNVLLGFLVTASPMKMNQLYINGKKYEETYLEEYKCALKDNSTFAEDFTLDQYLGEVVVPGVHFIVLGDNR